MPKVFNVVLSFGGVGPLYSALVPAPDRESAAAIAMQHMLQETPTNEPLQAVMAQEVSAETLRAMLRLVEGKPTGEVLSVVENIERNRRAAELLRTAPHEATPVADLAWARTDGTVCYGTKYGPWRPDDPFAPVA